MRGWRISYSQTNFVAQEELARGPCLTTVHMFSHHHSHFPRPSSSKPVEIRKSSLQETIDEPRRGIRYSRHTLIHVVEPVPQISSSLPTLDDSGQSYQLPPNRRADNKQ